MGRIESLLVGLAVLTGWMPAPVRAADDPIAGPAPDAQALEFFETKVRPVLANRCQGCHGADKQKGNLRLDGRASVLTGGDNGPAAVPGKPAESLLVEAVNYGDTVQMPPKSRLPAAEVAALTRWVEMGLPWPADGPNASAKAAKPAFDLKARAGGHWSWKPVVAHEVPAVKDVAWPAGAVDRFVLAALEAKGLRPAPDADRRTLFRRLSFDLVGLPPDPDDSDAFVADTRADALERAADRLLASPRFGERWARHWLDLVRYAETRGHEFDPDIPNAWRYRDYVVRALNADVPYNQFVTEHLAGDLVRPPRVDPSTGTNESILGTGFFFLGEEVHSPVDVRADEADRLDNKLDVMTKTFLGLTVACARCHDHKFDAISQRDYYALNGFLISATYRQARVTTLEREYAASASLQSLVNGARPRLLALAGKAVEPGLEDLPSKLLAAARQTGGSDWAAELRLAADRPAHPLHALAASLTGESKPTPQRKGPAGWKGTDAARREGSGRVVADFSTMPDLTRWQDGRAFGVRPARVGDLTFGPKPGDLGLVSLTSARTVDGWGPLPRDPGDGTDHGALGALDRSGRTLRTPEFHLGSGRLWYLVEGPGKVYAAVNSHTVVAGPLHAGVFKGWDNPKSTGWRWVGHDLTAYAGHRLHLEFVPSGAESLAVAAVVESDTEPGVPTVETEPATGSPADLADQARARLVETARRMQSDRVVEDPALAARAAWLLSMVDRLAPAESPDARAFRAEAEALHRDREAILATVRRPGSTAPAMLDGNGVDETLLIRGSTKTPGPVVPRRFLEALAGPSPIAVPDGGSGRLELARQVLGPDDPFARRVIVNRVWHHLFGRGIVASVDNFGVLGEPPTHPELLDHLAGDFVSNGWSVKRLIRTLVLSRAYRMSSRPDPEGDVADPNNLLLHRRTVRRLQAEPLRDAILAVSGRLDGRVGGPSVPVHLTDFLQGRGRPAAPGPVDGDGRRSLYLGIRRNFLSPMLLAFDAPIPFSTVGRRNVSNVPAQALTLLNDPFVLEQSRRWARRVCDRFPSPEDADARVGALFRDAFAREPTPAERSDALAFVAAQAGEFAGSADGVAAWADLAHVLINAKEFAFVE